VPHSRGLRFGVMGVLVSTALLGTFATAGSATSSAAPVSAPTPNDRFDLSEWNLTLPVDAFGGTGGTGGSEYAAATISTAQLLDGFTDAFFQLNADDDLVFTAPSNGATTTPGVGSNHTRSELHEYYTGPGAELDGTWPSALGGTLTATAVVDAVSADSDQATIGQIHGFGSAAFVLLIYRPASEEVALNVYGGPNDGAHAETVVLQNVKLGETLNYSLSFKDGLITAVVNGNVVRLLAGSAWDTYPVRFALGAYSSAPNTGNPAGDRTQVTFESFDISH
jgi:hypothetical protein